jgi:hypothetical protein
MPTPPESMPPPGPDAVPGDFRAVLRRWPSLRAVSRDLRVPYFTVASWFRRNKIIEPYWDPLAVAASLRGIPGVTYATFRDIAAAQRAQRRLAARGAAPPVDLTCRSGSSHTTGHLHAVATVVQGAQHSRLPPSLFLPLPSGTKGPRHAARPDPNRRTKR